MPTLLHTMGTVNECDIKSYRRHCFAVPPGLDQLVVRLNYDRGGLEPHTLITLSLYDPAGTRGMAHRFAAEQVIRIGPGGATPGFIAGPLTPGQWTVELAMFWIAATPGKGGCDYVVQVEGRLPRQMAQSPAPATAHAGRWYRGDLHLHSTHSDGVWTPDELIPAAQEWGLDFIALTDHNTVTGLPEFLSQDSGVIAIPGIELTTFHGHATCLGLDRWFDWRCQRDDASMTNVARQIREAGGVFTIVHPEGRPDDVCTGCRWRYSRFDLDQADAVQVWGGYDWDSNRDSNLECLCLWRRWLNDGHKLAAVGGSDAHRPSAWGTNTGRTYVWATDPSAQAIVDGIRAGRTYVSSGPALTIQSLDEEGNPAVPGADVAAATGGAMVRVCWNSCPPAELRVVVQGTVHHRQQVEGTGYIDTEAHPGDLWLCAELWAANASTLLAVTSPIYTVSHAPRQLPAAS